MGSRGLIFCALVFVSQFCTAQTYPYFPPPGVTYVQTNNQLSLTGVNPNFSLGGAGYTGATAIPALLSIPNTKEFIRCAGIPGAGTGLAGNNCGITEVLGAQGDYMLASGWLNPVFHYRGLVDSATASGTVFSIESTAGTGMQFGTSELSATACPSAIVAPSFVPAIGSAFCSFIVVNNANPFVLGMTGGTLTNTLTLVDWAGNGNSFFMALGGGAVPVKWVQGTSTGTNQATITLGDTNATSITNIRGGSPANTQANGVPILTGFTATSASIGGSALAAGACTTGTVTVTGATIGMDAHATPTTYPGDGAEWAAYISAANTVTLKVCAIIALTPIASTYNVRVVQ